MRLAVSVVTFLLLTGTAHAQPAINLWADDKKIDPEAEEKKQQIDKAYREKIRSQPAQAPAASDPWGNVRASETTQSRGQAGSKNR